MIRLWGAPYLSFPLLIALAVGLAFGILFSPSGPTHAQAITSTITITADQTSVYEGAPATFTLSRIGGNLNRKLPVQVKTWEPAFDHAQGNLTEVVHELTFPRVAATVSLKVNAWADQYAESAVQTLKAQIQAAANSEYTLGSPDTATTVVTDVNGDLTDAATVTIDTPQTEPREGSANNVIFRFTRSGGDTTQALTIDVRVEDPDEALRGDHWDTPPDIPTQVEFAADETTKTLRISLPDDQRDLTDPKVKAVLLPSSDVIGGEYGSNTMEEITVGDNDTAQELELNFGKDGTNDADVDEGDTLKVVVKRRQQDADNGTDATFTVRVESGRMGVDHVLDGWDSLPGNNGVYKDFSLEITGSDTEVEQTIDVPENGIEEDDWTYTASIRALEDHAGDELSSDQEAQYWTVKSGFRETEIDATDSGDSTGTVTLTADQSSVYEGQEATFTLTRTEGPVGEPVTVQLESSEPNRLFGLMPSEDDPSSQSHQVTMEPWETTAKLGVIAYVDSDDEPGGDPLRIRITGVGTGYSQGSPNAQTVEVNDPPSGAAIITLSASTTTVAEGNAAVFTLTRTGGDTTAALTVDIDVDDPSEFLRGNHFDEAPDIPSQVTFAADSTSATVTLTAVDDQRDVPDGSFSFSVVPSSGYHLGNTGLSTSGTVSVTDNDDAQRLRLWWGYLDSRDTSWEQGESYCEGPYQTCEPGPAEGTFYYDDNRQFRFTHELEEPWPAHFMVRRRAGDVGKTVTFVVRVEHNRGWDSPRHADWPTDPVTGKRYQEFPLTLTGDERQVVGRIELLDNGRPDPSFWEYTAEIKRVEDVSEGTVLTAEQEAQYWTVRGPRRNTINPDERGWPFLSLKRPTPNPVAEGGQVTFVVERSTGTVEALEVEVRTWEPNRIQPDGTNPSEQVHTITFPAILITDSFVENLAQTQSFTVNAMDDTDYETSDVLKAQLLTIFRRDLQPMERRQVNITDDDLPAISLTSNETSITEGDELTFTLTRSNNTTGDLTVGVAVDDPGGFLQGNYLSEAVEVPSSVAFAPGDVSKVISLTPPDDYRDIPDSTITFTVTEGPDFEVLGDKALTVQVADNDTAPQVRISFTDENGQAVQSAEEGNALRLLITRVGETTNPLEIPIEAGPAGSETSTVVGMDEGQSQVYLQYDSADDDYREPDRVYRAELFPISDELWTAATTGRIEATITENDPYTVSVETFVTRVNEGQRIYYRVSHNGHTGTVIPVTVEHTEVGNAVTDGNLGRWIHVIQSGRSGITRSFETDADDGSDGDAEFTITVVASDNYEIDPDASTATIIVTDKDPIPAIRLPESMVTVSEDVGTAQYQVDLVSMVSVARPVTVDYVVVDSGSSGDPDVVEASGTLTFAPGSTEAFVPVEVVQDNVAEAFGQGGTFEITLTNPVNALFEFGLASLAGRGVILDDEPVVSVESAPTAVTEGEDIVVTIARTGPTTEELTAWIGVVDLSDGVTVDRPAVTFASGSATAEYAISTEDDREDLGNYEVRVSVVAPSAVGEASTYHAAGGSSTVVVRDDELPKITIATTTGRDDSHSGSYLHVPDVPRNLEGEDFKFVVLRTTPGSTLTVNVDVSGAAAFVTSTFPTSVTIPSGETSVVFTISTEDDATAEDHATLTATVLDGTGYVPGDPESAAWTVYDNDASVPGLRIRPNEGLVDEGDNAVFTLTRDGATTDTLEVSLRLYKTRRQAEQVRYHQETEDITATFAVGSSTVAITSTTVDDSINYGNSTYTLVILPGPYLFLDADEEVNLASQHLPDRAWVWVQDDDRPTVTLGPAMAEYEQGEPLTATISRTGDTTVLLYVDTMREITRRYPAPFQDRTTLSDWRFSRVFPGESSTTVQFARLSNVEALGATGRVWLVPDSCPDGSEDCGVIDAPHVCIDHAGPDQADCAFHPQYHRGSPYEQTFIVYSKYMGVRIEADQTSVAEGGAATFTLHRHGGKPGNLAKTLEVQVAVTQDGDYIEGSAPTTVTFAAGESTATLSVPTADDEVDEMDGAVTATLLQPYGCTDDQHCYAIGQYVGTPWEIVEATTAVTDDDYIPPNVSIADGSGRENDGTIEFTVSLNAPNTQEVSSVDWATEQDSTDAAATSGTDFTAASGTVNFAIGETEKVITVTLTDDELDEDHETFNVTLSNPENATIVDGTATGTIIDNELAIAVIWIPTPGSVVEGEDVVFRAKRIPPRESGAAESADDPCYDATTCFDYDGEAPNTALTVKVRVTQEGDVISGTAPITLTFQPGSSFAQLTIPTVDDATVEATGIVTAELLNGAGYSPLHAAQDDASADLFPKQSLTVHDNDLTFSINDVEGSETLGTLDFTLSLNAAAPENVSVDVTTVDGEATSHSNVTTISLGKDYEAKTESITFATGERTKTFAVTLTDDTIYEDQESFEVRLSNQPQYSTLSDGTGVGTILDNEEEMVAKVTRSYATVQEDFGRPVGFMVQLSHATTTNHERDVAVAWSTADGTATAGEDYRAASGTVRLGPGTLMGRVRVDLIDDTLFEPELETFTVEIDDQGTSLAAVSPTEGSFEASIRDDETLAVSITANNENVVEGENATFTVLLKGGATVSDLMVLFETGGDATPGEDYSIPIGQINFPGGEANPERGVLVIPAGQKFGTITFPILEDGENEEAGDGNDEKLTVEIFAPSMQGRTALGQGRYLSIDEDASQAETTILDVGTLAVSIEGTPTVTEGEAATFTATLSKVASDPVLVTWTTRKAGNDLGADETAEPGADYTEATGTVSIPAGQLSATFTVQTKEDTLVEGDESFRVFIDEATKDSGLLPEFLPLGVTWTRGTITDNDDAPTGLTLTAAPTEVDEDGGPAQISATVALDGTTQFTTDTSITIEFIDQPGVPRNAILGTDYRSSPVQAVIPARQSSVTANITIRPIDDNLSEGSELARLTAASPVLSGDAGLDITILDDESNQFEVALAVSPDEVAEGASNASLEVTATLSGISARVVDTVVTLSSTDGTALAGTDYEAVTGTVTIPAGAMSATASIPFAVVDDTLDEDAETFEIVGSIPDEIKVVDPIEITIQDNDSPPSSIGLSATGPAITEGGDAVDLTVRATLLGGGTRTVSTTVDLDLSDQSATVADDYTASLATTTLTIPAGQFSAETTLTVTPVQDTFHEGDETLLVTGQNSTPGLTVNALRLVIEDDDPAPTVIRLSVDPGSIDEGASSVLGTVTATLDGASTLLHDVEVRVTVISSDANTRSSGSLLGALVIPAGMSDGEATIFLNNLDDELDDPNETITLRGTASTPGITVIPAELIVNNDDSAGFSVSPDTLEVQEGRRLYYSVKPNSQPSDDVTVTVEVPAGAGFTVSPGTLEFTPQSYGAKFVYVSGVQDDDSADEGPATITHSVSSSDTKYNGANADDVSVTVRDDETAGVTISENALTIEEGNTATYTVVLGTQPAGDVTVTISGHSGTDVSLDKTTLTFTDQDWSTEQTMTVTAENDDDTNDENDVTLTHTVASTDDSDYDGTAADSVTVSITDDDMAGATISKTALELEEGTSDTYTVVLDSPPAGDVTVTISGNADTDVLLDKTTLTFTDQDWNTEQTVTVTAEHDDDEQDEADVNLTHALSSTADTDYDGIAADSVTVSVIDDDKPRVIIRPTAVIVPEGYATGYTVVLNTLPDEEVTITVNDPTDNTDVTADPASLTFTTSDWHTAQLVTVNAAADADSVEDSATITHTVSGYGSVTTADDVAVMVTEESLIDVSVNFEKAAYDVDEGADVVVKVILDQDPERTLTIPLTTTEEGGATNADHSGIPSYLIFGPGETEVEFTFTAVDDSDDDDDEKVKIGFGTLPAGATAGTPNETTVSITDDELTQVVVRFAEASYTVNEGRRLLNVGIEIDKEAGRYLYIPYVFTPQGGASAEDYPFALHGAPIAAGFTRSFSNFRTTQDSIDDDGESIKLTFGTLPEGVTAGTPSETVITIVDDDTAGVTVEPTTLGVDEDGSGVYTVVLDSEPVSNVTVTINDPTDNTDATAEPASLTFTPDTWNTGQTVTVSAADDSDNVSETATVTHVATSTDPLYEGIDIDDVTVSITDDDAPSVTVAFGAAAYSVEETDDTETTETKENEVVVTVILSADPEQTVTIPITKTEQGGATSDDYSGVPANVVFDAGETSKTFTFTATADTVDDDGGSVKLGFGTLPTNVSAGTPKESTVSINDDDVPSVSVSFGATAYSVEESDDTSTTETKENEVVVTVALRADPERTVTIPITKTEQGDTSSADYSGVPPSVVFNAGETSKTITFAAAADSVDDDGESVKLTFGTLPSGVTKGTPDETTVSINDDDDPTVTVNFGSATYSVEESDDASTTTITENEVVVTVTLSADPERTVTIPLTTANQGGATSADYSGVPANVEIGSGSTSAAFTFTATADTIDDDGESVDLAFGTLPTGVSAGTPDESTISINDDDKPASVAVSFGAAAYTAAEGSSVTVTVALSDDPEQTVTIPITTTEEGGASSDDYSGVPASVVFNAGETSKTITFTATDDGVDDDGESVQLGFGTLPTTPLSVTAGSPNETTVTITDDDVPSVTVSFGSATYSVEESDDTATSDVTENQVVVTVTLSADPERTVTIPITTDNQGGATSADYSGVPASVEIANGQTSATFTLTATADTIDDDGESVDLGFGTLPTGVTAGTPDESTISINDDDKPTSVTVSFGAAAYTAAEGSSVTVTVALSDDPEQTVTIPITTTEEGGASSDDYSGVPASVVFNAGETSKTITFTATGDDEDDDGESVKLSFGTLPTTPLSVTTGSPSETTVTITDDDDPMVTVSFGAAAYSVEESDDASTTTITENQVAVTVTLSADPERTVTIPITKTEQGGASSSDYSGVPASVVFNAGETSKTFTFTATADTIDDDGESVDLGFGTLPTRVTAGTPDESTISINDDDRPTAVTVSFGAAAYTAAEGGSATVTVTLSDDPEQTVAIPLTKTEQGGATSDDYSGVPASVSFASGETAKTITFAAASDAVDDDGESVKLGFGTLPSTPLSVTAGSPSETTVTITDDDDPMVTVSFGAAAYSVEESDDASTTTITENEVVVTVTLSVDPERTVAIPLTTANQGGASNEDYSGVPSSVTFNAGETSKTFTFTAETDTVDDDGESVDLGFGTLPTRVSAGTPDEATVTINDDDKPTSVTVSFGAATYTAAEGSSVNVTVALSDDPEQTVTIPITKTEQGGATSDDYSGVPASVSFASGETSKTITFTATGDDEDDDGESVQLGFGTLPTTPLSVTAGTPNETTVTITDDDVPTVTVAFGSATYSVEESDDTSTTGTKENEVVVTVTLSADPERTVTIPLTKTDQGGATSADYSGVPASVVFDAGETSKTFTFTATADSVDDDGESIKLAFGTLPTEVTAGTPDETTVSINDDDKPSSVTVSFGAAAYTVAESDDDSTTGVMENRVTVTVALSDDPEQTVTIPITKTEQGGASSADYGGVPASVVFNAGEASKNITFTATGDDKDDDGESVKLRFGTLPTTPLSVTAGTPSETTVSITDDDEPSDRLRPPFTSPKRIDTFDPDVFDYMLGVDFTVTQYSITLTPFREDDTITFNGTEVANGSTQIVDLSVGLNTHVIVVSSSGSVDPATYTVYIGRGTTDYGGWKAGDDLDGLRFAGNTNPTGIWSGDTTMWIADSVEAKLFAYVLADGSRDSVKDISLHDDNSSPAGIWSDETTIWVADDSDDKLYAYTLADGSRDTSKEFALSDGNANAWGLWSDGTTMWVADDSDDKLYAYTLSDGSRDSTKDFGLATDNGSPRGIWSNGTTMWVADADDSKLYAYDLSGTRVAGYDISLHSTNSGAAGIWGDDDTVWVVNGVSVDGSPFDRVYTYNKLPVTVGFEQDAYSVAEGRSVDVKVTLSADPERTVSIPLTKADQGGASPSDYSGVPASVVFNSGETEKTFTFNAAGDNLEDGGESVKLGSGTLPAGVTAGDTKEATVSILNVAAQDSLTVSFAAAGYALSEGNTTTITVSLNTAPGSETVISLTTVEQGGASDADYSGVPASLTFGSNDTQKTFTFSAIQDSVDDDDESVKIGFGTLPGGVSAGSTSETTVTINDDDKPTSVTVSFGAAAYTAAEGSSVTVTVALSDDPEQTVAIPITKTEQGGASNSDYSGVPASVVFNAGETSKTITFTAASDSEDDDGESVKLSFGTLPTTPLSVTAGSPSETTVTITDDDVPTVTVAFGSATYSVEESDDTSTTGTKENEVVVTVTLSADPERTVTIPITTANQGGATSADYSGVPASVVFDAGETSKTFTFTATADSVDDDGESIKLAFGTLPTEVTDGTPDETTVTINDDDKPSSVTVSFGAAAYTVAESDDSTTTGVMENQVTVTVALSDDPEQTVTIAITTANQGGASNSDYSGVPSSVSFASGETSQTITFTAASDSEDDDGESVKLGFGSLPTTPLSVTAGTPSETIISITDDDVPSVTVSFGAASYSVDESDDATTTGTKENEVVVTVTLSADPERTVTIPINKAEQDGATGADYSGVPASVVFDAGETSKTFTFTATADTIDDDGESVKLVFGTLPTRVSAGTPDEATVSIIDDDEEVIQPQTSVKVSYGSVGYTIGEGQSISIKVVLDNDPERTVEIPISTANSNGATDDDYSGVPTSVTFDSGDTEKEFTFTAVQDNEDESDETVTLGFGTMPSGVSAGATSEATVTITDSIHVSFGASTYQAYEGGSGALVTVNLDPAPLLETVIPVTATPMDGATDDDWTGVPESLTFGSGDTEKSFTVMAYDDTVEDDGESVELSFGTLPAGVGRGTTDKATVELMNSEGGVPPACADAVWCAMVEFADVSDDWGNMALMHHPNQDPGPDRSEISDDRFEFDDEEFFIWGIHTYPGVYPDTLAGAPGVVPERSVLSLSLGRWDHTERFSGRVSSENYMDWVLWMDGKGFPFSEASQATGLTFVWVDEKFQSLFANWSEGNEYQLMIESSPINERPAPVRTMPSPPRYLKVMHFNESFLASWINPLDDGNARVTHYRLEWKPASASWDDQGSLGVATVVPDPSDRSTNGYLVGGLTNGVAYDVRVIAVNSEGDSLPSNEHFARPQDSEPEVKRNTVDGKVLTLTYDRDLDETSIPESGRFVVFANKGRRLLENVAVTGKKVVITLESGVNSADVVQVRYVAPEEADVPAIKDTNGRYSFSLNFASEMSATENLTDPALLEDLTAEFVDIPDSHTGGEIRFKIRFSDPVQVVLGPYFAYLLDVQGGEVTSAWWLDRDTSLWQIVLMPDDTHDITVTLPAGRACNNGNSRGAPCASGDRRLTSALEHTISGQDGPRDTRSVNPEDGGAEEKSEQGSGNEKDSSDDPEPNSHATGAPVINGVARVDETLTVHTSGISDADGITNATFAYQWTAGGDDISGADSASYTLTANEDGLVIRVKVSFTDDAGNPESVTSGGTAAVAPRLQPPPAPEDLSATVNADGTVTLAWDAPDDASVTGYQILRRRPTEGETSLLVYEQDTGSTATTFTDRNVEAGIPHVYRVKAINAAGTGEWSNFVRVEP